MAGAATVPDDGVPPVGGEADRDSIVEYCRDPLFERAMTLPWPYEPQHADFFVRRHAPDGWADDTEYTWALRRYGAFLGVIGWRAERGDLGFWLGAPHRGHGYMPEAVHAVADWLFARGVERIGWECVVGNTASASVARKAGFVYTHTGPTDLLFRDGTRPLAWHAILDRDRTPPPAWPSETFA